MLSMTNQIVRKTLRILTATCLSAVIGTAMTAQVKAAEPTTNINPALLYYQAFTLAPNYSQSDWDYLYANLSNSWRGQKLPARFGELMAEDDNRFKLLRDAAQQTAPCDWGIDWDYGPATLLPQLARAKQVAVMVQFRTAWNLQNDRQSEACEDLLATLALARNCARDSALVGVLVELADENLVCESVAENFGRFSAESLQRLEDGLAAGPARVTMAQWAATEHFTREAILAEKVRELRQAHPGNDAAVMSDIQPFFDHLFVDNSGEVDTKIRAATLAASGGTSDGLLKLTDAMKPLHLRSAQIMALPYPSFQGELDKFNADVEKSGNPIATLTFEPLAHVRQKEFRSEMNLAVLRAAIEYKLRGQAGLQSVADPFGQGPFKIQRFVLNGTDRGFKLQSAITGLGVPAEFIFLEKAGTPVHLDGLHVGEPLE